MWSIPTMEYHSALKREGIWIQGTTMINLEDIMLSEIRQSEKDKYGMTTLI